MKRLLLLSSDTGEGHNSAATAIRAAAGTAGWRVSLRKPADEAAAAFRLLNGLYNSLLTYRPGWVGVLARAIDRWRPNEADFCYRRVRGYIGNFLDSEAPDVILSVHPMLNHMIQRWVAERNLRIPCYTFVTDPYPPFWKGWSSPYVDRYFVLTDEAAGALEHNGVSPARIERVLMPLRAGFRPRQPDEVAALRSRLRVTDKVILVNGGARGGGPLRRLVHAVREAAPDFHLLVVCGSNQAVRKQLDRLGDVKLRTFGFVRDIDALIGAADLVVTKPGALSTYESLAARVPAVLTAIGGLMPQESGLFHAARRQGFGFAVRTVEELRGVVSQGVDAWGAKRDAIAKFYGPESAPNLIERIQPSHVRC